MATQKFTYEDVQAVMRAAREPLPPCPWDGAQPELTAQVLGPVGGGDFPIHTLRYACSKCGGARAAIQVTDEIELRALALQRPLWDAGETPFWGDLIKLAGEARARQSWSERP